MLFPTTLVGSYPQPEWLIDRQKLGARRPRSMVMLTVGNRRAMLSAARLSIVIIGRRVP